MFILAVVTKKWHKTAGIYVGGLFLTALVGASVKSYVDRPTLDVNLTAIRIATPTLEQLIAVGLNGSLRGRTAARSYEPDAELMQITADHTWLPTVQQRGTLDDYIATLLRIQIVAEELLVEMENLRQDLRRWPREGRPDPVAVFDIIRSNSAIVFPHLFGEARRNARLFPGRAPSFDRRPRVFQVSTDSDGDYYIDRGLHRLGVFWSTTTAPTRQERERVRTVAQRVVDAISYADSLDLTRLRTILEASILEEGATLNAIEIVRRELDKYSRVVVTATVANRGRTTIALDPRGMFYVQAEGAVIESQNGRPLALQGTVRIPVTYVEAHSTTIETDDGPMDLSYSRRSQIPLVIAGGQAISVTFESDGQVGMLDGGPEALAVFRGSGAPGTLGLLPLTADKLSQAVSPIAWSNPYLFRGLNVAETFPQRPPR